MHSLNYLEIALKSLGRVNLLLNFCSLNCIHNYFYRRAIKTLIEEVILKKIKNMDSLDNSHVSKQEVNNINIVCQKN